MLKRGGSMGGRGANSSIVSKSSLEAVEHYVSGEGMWINQYLRGKEEYDLTQNEKRYLSDLEKATNEVLGETQTLYRSVDASAIFGDMDTFDFENFQNEVVYNQFSNDKGSYSQSLAKKYKNKATSVIGKKITEKGFMSTTKDYSTARNWNGFTGSNKEVVMEIKTKRTAKGVNLGKKMSSLNKRMGQNEVLLKRNQSYTVNNVSSKDGKIYVQVSMD